ncbi:uncharacterized protein TNCV_452331 [Trichonephila clavipes]|nr:uncharacterized protein TNCV_452331 [Trichonephila clavipes]
MPLERTTGNVSKERKGPPKMIRTPKNVERVVNSDRYVTMIQQFLPALQEKDPDNVWLQQDGATAHTKISMSILRAAFPRMTDLPTRGRKLACVYYSESPEEPDSLVESYSSTSTATFNRIRTRLSASASDLTSLQVKEDPWLKIGVLTSPRVRSLDDIHNLRKDSLTNENKERIESLEFADNLSATWRSSYTIDELRLLSMSKEDIVRMWQGSERALLNRLQDTLKEKRLLEQKLAFLQKTLLKPP